MPPRLARARSLRRLAGARLVSLLAASALWSLLGAPSAIALVQQGSKLLGGGELGSGGLGQSAVVSADGNTALVGAAGDDAGAGAAWVFTRSGYAWTQQGPKLTGGEEIGAGGFGRSAAISADGNTLLIGGAADNASEGAAWVFARAGAAWIQQGPKLSAGPETVKGCCGADFGSSVALSADGNTAFVGAFNDANGTGAAWVFSRTGSTWGRHAPKLTANAGEELLAGGFGASLALSADASTALIGSPEGRFRGSVYAFVRAGATWVQQGEKLAAAAKEASQDFGKSAAISADGKTALIGGLNGTSGAAWVFTRSGSVWAQQGEQLVGFNGQMEEVGGGLFGASVALSADGNTALIGGPHDGKEVEQEKVKKLETNVGAAWIYTRSGSTWTQQGKKLTAKDETGEGEFGSSVALSADGGTALVGGLSDAGGAGAAWAFGSAPPSPPPPPAKPQAPPRSIPLSLDYVSESDSVWREGSALAAFARRRTQLPVGTTFSFILSKQASVSFAYTQSQAGRKVESRCVAQTLKNGRKPRCRRTLTRGTLSFAGHPGVNLISFEGRLSRTKRLKPGSYTLVIVASNAAGEHTQPQSLSFRIER